MISQQKLNKNLLIEKLRSYYFELISYISSSSYEKILLKLTEKLNELLNTRYTGIYVSDQWHRSYQLISNQIEGIPSCFIEINRYIHLLQEKLFRRSFINGNVVFKQHLSEIDSLIIKLRFHDRTNYLLLVFKNNQLSKDLIRIIQKETVRLMEIMNTFYRNKDCNRKKEFLLELSSHLNASKSKTDVLNKLIASLQVLYPNFTYNLLMSHDYETDSGLPIKSFEYSDDVTECIRTRAFTTGETQMEESHNEKNLYAPLTGNQGIYGVIQISTPKQTYFSNDEIQFISKFAHTAGQAIENITLYEGSIHLISNLKLINDVTHKMNLNLKFTELIEIVKDEIINICCASEVGFVYYREDSTSDFDILEESTSFFNSRKGYDFVKFLARQMEQRKESIFSGDYSKSYLGLPFKSLIAVPMIESGFVYGFIIIMHEESSYFTFESFKLMQSLIHHSTLALTNSVLRDKLERAVITDYLTKLYSRSHLDEMLNKHMQTDEKGTLILLDIDDFKKINDTYGHYIGDEVIVQIAEIIMKNIEEGDIPSRWGGEEFAIYLPQKSMLEGVQLAEQLRDQVVQETEPKVSFSCGISTWDKSKVDSVSEVFIRADKALYEAKEMGKNCIVTSS